MGFRAVLRTPSDRVMRVNCEMMGNPGVRLTEPVLLEVACDKTVICSNR